MDYWLIFVFWQFEFYVILYKIFRVYLVYDKFFMKLVMYVQNVLLVIFNN